MTEHVCELCNQPREAMVFICANCSGRLNRALRDLPEVASDLQVELANQSVKGHPSSGGGSSAGGNPAPINFDAADVIHDIKRAVLRACAMLPGEVRPTSGGLRWRCNVLMRHSRELAGRAGIAEMTRDMERLVRKGWSLIDLPLERVGIGTCTCGATLIAGRNNPDETGERAERLHRCRDCGAEWAVEESLRSLEAITESDYAEHLLTPSQIEQATGRRIRANRVSQWVARGKVVQDQQHRVRFGDVLDLERATHERRKVAA